jgi:hypothetical protein
MMFAWMLHKPVYSVVPHSMIGHPWIGFLSSGRVYEFIDEALEIIEMNR